jgi:hypothetical protein
MFPSRLLHAFVVRSGVRGRLGLRRSSSVCAAAVCSVVALASTRAAIGESVSIELAPIKDATLTQDASEELGSGSSDSFFAGRVGSLGGGTRRRALIAFDIAAAIPAGSTIVSAQLVLQMTQTASGPQTVSLFRVVSSWSEGPSFSGGGQGVPAQPGDCTWKYRLYPDVLWSTQGGDFVATASASLVVNQTASYAWSSTGMRNDVQAWLDQPLTNFGWLLRGNEAVQKTVKKFASRESLSPDFRPRLVVVFEPPPPCVQGDLDCDGAVDAGDLAVLLGAWGSSGPGDLDGDGAVGSSDLAILLGAWTPDGAG